MRKVLSSILSLLLVVVIMIGFIPINRVNTIKAEASGFVEGFSLDNYMAGILLNTDKSSCAVSDTGISAASINLEFYSSPQVASLSGSFVDVLQSDVKFMTALAVWETVTFEPNDIIDSQFKKQGYYQTVLFDMLEIAVKNNYIPSILTYANDSINCTIKSINELKIKSYESFVNSQTQLSLVDAAAQHAVVMETYEQMNSLKKTNITFEQIDQLVSVSTSVVETVLQTESIALASHIDSDKDGYCDYCDLQMNPADNCSCICHKGGFMGFVYKIFRFFWKLFGIKQTCDCGASHW